MSRDLFYRLGQTFFFFIFSFSLHAQAFDPTFGTGGYSNMNANTGNVMGMAVQQDGKIITNDEIFCSSCAADFWTDIIRYNSDGSIDTTYGTGGVASIFSCEDHSHSNDVALQSNGKCICGGITQYCTQVACHLDNVFIFRLDQSGRLDTTFGTAGIVKALDILPTQVEESYVYRVQVLPNDKILIGGFCYLFYGNGLHANVFVARLNADGSPDYSFGQGGTSSTLFGTGNYYSMNDFTTDANGNIFVTGSFVHMNDTINPIQAYVIKMDMNGIPDNNFGLFGETDFNLGYYVFPQAIGVRSDGKILVGGYFERYNYQTFPDDTAFVAVLEPNGNLSTSVSNGYRVIDLGKPACQIKDIEMLNDDRFLITGTQDTAYQVDGFIGRLNSDASLDTSFSGDGRSILSYALTGYSSWQSGTFLYRIKQLPNCQVLAGGGINYSSSTVAHALLLMRLNTFNCPLLNSIAENNLQDNISVFPNPNNGNFTIEIKGNANDILIEVMDLQGRIVFNSREKNEINGFYKEMKLDCDAGIYLLRVSENGKQSIQKIVIGN